MNKIHMFTFILLIAGGLNWGLVSFGYNAVNMLFGGMPQVEQVIYVLIGLSAVAEIVGHKKDCKSCAA